jgi:acetyltransferase-like isoleucine patch superfamily enzyme
MKSLAHYRKRLDEMDFYDYINFAHALAARLKGVVFYAAVLGGFGRRSWLKKPDLIYGAGRIHIGDDVRIEKGAVLYAVKKYSEGDYEGNIRIGHGSYLNRYFNATSAVGIEIGEKVAFGTNVFVCDFDHGYTEPGASRLTSALVSKGPIRIGDRCWIGSNSFIASGVEIGADCVVGANSVVTQSFPAFTVIAGSPAKAIRTFDADTKVWKRVEANAFVIAERPGRN